MRSNCILKFKKVSLYILTDNYPLYSILKEDFKTKILLMPIPHTFKLKRLEHKKFNNKNINLLCPGQYREEKFGTNFPNTVQVRQSTYISLDAATLETGLAGGSDYWQENDLIGGLDFEITATNYEYKTRTSDSYFPFDRYSATLTGMVSVQTEGVATQNNYDDDYYERLPIQYVSYTGSVANFSLAFDYAYSEVKSGKDFSENLNDGELGLLIKIERPILTKAIVFILGLLFMSGGVLLLFLLRAIRIKKRPAQLTGLVWGASTAFTMIQARSLFPGDPRNGVKLDLFIFYPLLSLCFISVILIFREWVRQEHTPREIPPVN